MSAIITNKFRFLSADLFYDKVYNMNITNPNETDIKNLYFFIGRPKTWDTPYNDLNPTPPSSSINNEYQCHMDCLSLKRIDVGENLCYVVPRYDWVSGVVYAMYDDQDMDLYNHPSQTDLDIAATYLSLHPGDPWVPGSYYVVTDEWEVYICLSNGSGPYGIDGRAAKSTVKPTGGPEAGSTRYIVGPLADGYVWKYLYTLSQDDINKYVTDSWIPVKYLTSNDGSDQWFVQNLPNNVGSIDIIKIDNEGSSVKWYGEADGEPSSIGVGGDNDETILLSSEIPSGVGNTNDMYVGCSAISVRNSDGNTEIKDVIEYNSSTYTITVDSDWAEKPGSLTHKLYIAPRVVITGNVINPVDMCTARCIIDSSTNKIKKINVIDHGIGYKLASVKLYGNGTGELTDVSARLIIPPTNGHGANPKIDLGAWFVMLNTRFKNVEGGTDFPTLNDYRRMGLLRDIYDNGTTNYSTALTLRGCKMMDVDNVDLSVGGFEPDEIIEYLVGPDVIASALVIEYSTQVDSLGQMVPDPNHPGKFLGTLKYYQDSTTGFDAFVVGNTITGKSSGLTVGITNLYEPEYEPYSGQVLYIEQRRPIVRAQEQQEEIRIVIEF